MTAPSRSQPEVWSQVWQHTRLTPDGVRATIRREQRTRRWQFIRQACVEHFGRIDGVSTIELGAGTGDISLLMALEGARPTLFDADALALDLAREKFSVAGLTPAVRTGDFLNFDPQLEGRYDAALSYGTVEHFAGGDRLLACRAHALAVRPGGLVVISVPNAHCLPYRLDKWWREARGTWEWGLELPYTRGELFRIASELGLGHVRIHGSPFLRDWDQFLLNPLTQRIERHTGFHFERPSPVDRWWGHALTLVGVRQ